MLSFCLEKLNHNKIYVDELHLYKFLLQLKDFVTFDLEKELQL